MSAARIPADQKHRLAIVQGGRAQARASDDQAGWDDFCHRIGWQDPAPEPDDDFEKRIAEGLFSRRIEDDNVIDIGLARAERRDLADSGTHEIDPAFLAEIRRSFIREAPPSPVSERRPIAREAHGVEDDGPRESLPLSVLAAPRFEDVAVAELAADTARKPRRWARVAMTLGLAAAVLLAVTQLASPRAPTASIPVPSAETALALTAEPQVDDSARLDAPPPPVLDPLHEAPEEQPTAKPSPRPKTPHVQPKPPSEVKPEPPGSLVAQRDAAAPADRRSSEDRPASPGSRGADHPKYEPPSGPAFALAGWTAARAPAFPSVPWTAAANHPLASAGGTPALSKTFSDAWPSGSSAEGWSSADTARPAYASWSLSGEKNRWLGASLTPSGAMPLSSDAQRNVGVMVQLDLGRAIDNL